VGVPPIEEVGGLIKKSRRSQLSRHVLFFHAFDFTEREEKESETCNHFFGQAICLNHENGMV
jgi:hypothetical protein